MTGTNTDVRQRLRAVFLAFIMVTSVMGATVAFSGTAAAANASITDPTTAGDTVTVEVENSTGVTVNDDSNITAIHQYNGEQKQLTGTGPYTADFSAAQGTHTIEIFINGTSEFTRDYTAENYFVEVTPDEVTHGDSREVSGEIYEYYNQNTDSGTLEDDQQVNYAVWFDDTNSTPGDTLVTDSNTNTGQFTTLADFNAVDDNADNDYPADASPGDDPQYVVTVGTGDLTTGPDDNSGSATILTRLDVNANPQSADYAASPTFRGDVANANGPLDDYTVQFRDPGDDVVRQTTTNASGNFAFTKTVDDAGDWTLGTGTDFIGYQTVTVDAEQANVTLSADSGNTASFEQVYSLSVADADGNALDTTTADAQGYVNVTGEFQSGSVSGATVSNITSGGDGSVAYFYVETDANGEASFTATPTSDAASVVATLENVDAAADDDSAPEDGLENANDEADSPESPDYVGSADVEVTGADPVNVNNFDIVDENTQGGSYDAADSIFADGNPEVVEVVPVQSEHARVESGDRIGNDTFSNLEGLTTYQITFDLANESNENINPSALTALNITGAGVNATLVDANDDDAFDSPADETGVVSASATTGTYTIVIRPTEVESADEQLSVEVNAEGADPVTAGAEPTDGLDVAQFQVDGESTDTVAGSSTVDLSAFIETPDDTPVNNGRVRLSQDRYDAGSGSVEPVALGNVDGRQSTTNINNGAYAFTNLDIGPRGIDTDDDGVGEDISSLTFTAYQYNDTDSDGSVNLENNEVTRGAVETLDLEVRENLQVEYDESAEYAGSDENGTYTLTRGVEYDQLNFTLTDENGAPVNLTAGIDQEVSDLDTLSSDGLVYIETTNDAGETVQLEVSFDDEASDPANGTYVISDIEAVAGTNVDSTNAGTQDGDSFVIDSPGLNASAQQFQLVVETPDRSQQTTAETGGFEADNAQVNGEVVGVAGADVPNSASASDLGHDQADDFNTNVSDINETTIGINRVYRVNATVTDALGTPLNGSAINQVRVTELSAYSGEIDYEPVSGVSGVDTTAGGSDEVEINNADGFFQFDMEPESDDGGVSEGGEYVGYDGELAPRFNVEAQDDVDVAPMGQSEVTGTPTGQLPVVEVYDRSGAELPTNGDGDEILAQDVNNRLRVEAFPASPNDFALPDGQEYGFSQNSPKAETVAGTTTTLSGDVVTDGFDQGQLGFLSVTPTGTGDKIMVLTNSVSGTNVPPGAVLFQDGLYESPVVSDTNGNPVVFDVLSSNLQVDIALSSTTVDAGNNVTVTLTQQSTGETLDENTRVSLVNPDGNEVTSALTDATGEAVLTVPANASVSGTFTIQTRPAGFEPNSVDLTVNAPEAPASVAFGDTTVQNGTTEVTVDSATLDDGGFVVIHDSNISSDGAIPSAIGASAYLEPGTTDDVTVQLERPITSNETLIAMAHRDTNGNETYDFVTSNGSADGPYTFNGQAITDDAAITTQPESPLSGTAGEYDDNGDGDITAAELGDAVTQFAQGNLNASELGDVVTAYAQS